ncbi:MAG: hypothetical protein SOV26_05620 [Candidatus Onthovivens sp.]|nr:hypothetical protein [Candidatus Onthovivens sp.]
MENLDLFYRALEKYKKDLELDPETGRFLKVAKRYNTPEAEQLNILYSTVEIEEDWVNAIEHGLPYIEKAIKEDRQFIRTDGDIVPIEKVKKISKSSIEDLSKHSNYITHESESDEISVMPDKLFVLNKESDYAVYENKVLYATLIYLKDFVSIRLSKIKDLARTFEFDSSLNKKLDIGNRKIDISLKINEKRLNDPTLNSKDISSSVIDRLDDILTNIMGLLKYPLMIELSKAEMVSRPITKTNVLRMNTNFRESLALFDYIAEYSKDGYTVKTTNKSFNPFNDELQNSFSSILMTYSFMSYIYSTQIEGELKRRKEEQDRLDKIKSEEELLLQLKHLEVKANTDGKTLVEYVRLFETGYRILEKKLDDLNLQLEQAEIKRKADLEDLRVSYENKIILINEENEQKVAEIIKKCEKDIEEIKLSTESRVEEIEQNCQIRIDELNSAFNEKINSLTTNYENLLADKTSQINSLNSEISTLKQEISKLLETNKILCADEIARKELSGEGNDFDQYLSEMSFDELERKKAAFDKFYKVAWNKAKKSIVKENIKIVKKTKKKKEEE